VDTAGPEDAKGKLRWSASISLAEQECLADAESVIRSIFSAHQHDTRISNARTLLRHDTWLHHGSTLALFWISALFGIAAAA